MEGFYRRMEVKPRHVMREALERQLHIAAFIVVRMFFKRIMMNQKIHERNACVQTLMLLEMLKKYRSLQQLRQRKHMGRNGNQQNICKDLFHQPKSRLYFKEMEGKLSENYRSFNLSSRSAVCPTRSPAI